MSLVTPPTQRHPERRIPQEGARRKPKAPLEGLEVALRDDVVPLEATIAPAYRAETWSENGLPPSLRGAPLLGGHGR
jgi:hypothetical protein